MKDIDKIGPNFPRNVSIAAGRFRPEADADWQVGSKF